MAQVSQHQAQTDLVKFHQQQLKQLQEEIGDYLSDTDLVLDGGPSEVGLESTIIDCTSNLPRILRPGAITISMIEAVTGLKVSEFIFRYNSNDSKQETFALVVRLKITTHPKQKYFLDQQPVAGSGFIALEKY